MKYQRAPGGSKEWETPQALFDALEEEFRFTLDACATPENAKCKLYFTREISVRTYPWNHCQAPLS